MSQSAIASASGSSSVSGHSPSSSIQIRPLSIEDQEAILKQRIQVDERPIKRVIKKLSNIGTSQDHDSLEAAILSFNLELELLQLNLERLSSIANNTSNQEILSYKEELRSIQLENSSTRERIVLLKQRLRDVQRDRANKLEYDLLATEIAKYPTRSELSESLTRLGSTIANLKAESSNYTEVSQRSRLRFSDIVRNLEGLHADVGFEVGERERREVERDGGDDADGEGEGEGEGEAGTEATEEALGKESQVNVDGQSTDEAEGNLSTSTTGLNPSAAIFKPVSGLAGPPSGVVSRASTPSTTTSERRSGRSRKRNRGNPKPASGNPTDEEGELEEGEERIDAALDPDSPAAAEMADEKEEEKVGGRASKKIKMGKESSATTSPIVDEGEEGEVEVEGDSEEEEGSILPAAARR